MKLRVGPFFEDRTILRMFKCCWDGIHRPKWKLEKRVSGRASCGRAELRPAVRHSGLSWGWEDRGWNLCLSMLVGVGPEAVATFGGASVPL